MEITQLSKRSKKLNSFSQIDEVLSHLRYDAETGNFYWRPRSPANEKCPKSVLGFNKRFAGELAGAMNNNEPDAHVIIFYKGIKYSAHRLVWYYHHKEWPLAVIHKNGIRTDNRYGNLTARYERKKI